MSELNLDDDNPQMAAEDLQKVICAFSSQLIADPAWQGMAEALQEIETTEWPVEGAKFRDACSRTRETIKAAFEVLDKEDFNEAFSALERLAASEPTEAGWNEIRQIAGCLYAKVCPRIVENKDLIRKLTLLSNVNLNSGTTKVFGFSRFNVEQRPTSFTMWRYSIDAMIPVIDLHAYSTYYPESPWMRGVSVVQHICGWWWLTVFIASAAIL